MKALGREVNNLKEQIGKEFQDEFEAARGLAARHGEVAGRQHRPAGEVRPGGGGRGDATALRSKSVRSRPASRL
jgi:hypothetical protein